MSCKLEEETVRSAQDWLNQVQGKAMGFEPESPEWMEAMLEENVAQAQLHAAMEELRRCRTAARLLVAEGFVTLLRVNELKSGYGGGDTNFLNAEAIFKIDSDPHKAFGFQMREDKHLPVRNGMLSILQNAMIHDLRVRIDYIERVETPNQNSFVIRIAVLHPRPARPLLPSDVEATTRVNPN